MSRLGGSPVSSPLSARSDTSPPALVLSKRATLVQPDDMSLDVSFASPGRKPAGDALFFDSDDDEPPRTSPDNARARRMQTLKALARERAPPQEAQVHSDVSEPEIDRDEPEGDSPRPAPVSRAPRIKPLSKKEQLEMHRITAQLRREQRTGIARAEPKRYQLSELLSTIEHTKRSPNERRLMHSSDPIESSSTPPERRQSPSLMPPNMDPDGEVFVDAPSPSASRQRKERLLQRHNQAQDSDDDLVVEPAQSLHHRMRASSEAPDVSDAQLDAAAHTFALASDRAAGMVPTSPIRSTSVSPARPRVRDSPRVAPVLMNMEQFNATLLRKTQEQNAARNAHRRPQDSTTPSSEDGSEKENVPLPQQDDGDVFNDDGDLGRFFVPTQAPDAHGHEEHTQDAPEPSAPRGTFNSHQSESSVLAQFFESTQEGQPRGASLDLFANQRRDGPVGGTARRLDSAVRSDAFAALREREQLDAKQLLSPVALPSLDPSVAERHEEALRAAHERRSDTLYLNQDGFFTQTKPGTSTSREQWLLPSQMDDPHEQPRLPPVPLFEQADQPAEANSDAESDADGDAAVAEPSAEEHPAEADSDAEEAPTNVHTEADSDAEGESHAPEADSDAEEAPRAPRQRNAFVFGEAEESEEEDGRSRDAGHGGLAGIFSDNEVSEAEEDSDDDADLESLLDDERDEDEETKDVLAHKRYMEHRLEDDAAAQALHERAAKGMLRTRRRGRTDGLGEMLDDEADEDELRRRLRAPRFQSKRRRIDGDEMDALASREESLAFVRQYSETHTSADDFNKYEFLAQADSSDEEAPRTTITAREVRDELLRHRFEREQTPEERSDEETPVTLRAARRPVSRIEPQAEDDDNSRLLFTAHRLDPDKLSNEQKARRELLLAEYSNEPDWREVRGGSGGLDRRGSGNRARARASMVAPAAETRAEPRRLVGSLLRRKFAS